MCKLPLFEVVCVLEVGHLLLLDHLPFFSKVIKGHSGQNGVPFDSISLEGHLCGCLANNLETKRGKVGLKVHVDFSRTRGRPARFYILHGRQICKGCDDCLYEQARLSNVFLPVQKGCQLQNTRTALAR